MTAKVKRARALRSLIARMPDEIIKDLDDVLFREAKALAGQLAFHSMPWGQDIGDRNTVKFMNRITREIFQIFSPAAFFNEIYDRHGEATANAFWWMIKKKVRVTTIRKFLGKLGYGITVQSTVPRTVHQQARTGRRGMVPRRAKVKTLVRSEEKIRAYAKKTVRNVGAGAAGWAAAGKAVPGSGRVRQVPPWKNTGRHRKSTGRAYVRGTGRKRAVVLINDVPWAQQALTRKHRLLAVQTAAQNLNKAAMRRIPKTEKALEKRMRSV